MPTKKCTMIAPIVSNSPLHLHQIASSSKTATSTPTKKTFVTLNPSIQNIKTHPNSLVHIAEDNTILIGNKTYKIINATSGATKAEPNGTILLGKPPSTGRTKVCIKIINI